MKKLLCLLLAGLMLFSMAACGETTDDPTYSPDDTGSNTSVGDAEIVDPSTSLGLSPDLKFNHERVTILYPKNTNFPSEIYSAALTNSVIPDSVYERNLATEERLAIQLECNESEDVIGDLTKDIQSGLGDFDLVANMTHVTVPAIVEGKFLILNNLENIDFDKAYWSNGYADMVTFTDDNLQFLASGSLAISMYRYMYTTLYNKNLFTDNHIPDLYDTVMNGEWTLDKQLSISKNHYVDNDGDGAVSKGDFYGFVTGNCVSVDPYMVATDTHLVTREADSGDLIYNDEAGVKLVDVCDKIQALYHDASTYYYDGASEDDVMVTNIIDHFTAERALMATTLFVQMEMNFADLAPMSYGIAPMPKFDTNQKSYYSYVQDQVTGFGISSVVGDPARQEMCAAVLETMAYFSHKLVRPAYYDTALSERYMQDPQSKEILDLIFDTIYFDFSSTCANMLPIVTRDSLRGLLTDTTNTIASSTKGWQKSIKNGMAKLNRKLADVVENQTK